MQKYTSYLFYLSLILSCISYWVISKGGKEIYPFYTWKLFTKPSGFSNKEQFYKLYGIKGNDTVRILNTNSEIYDGNDKFGIVNYFGKNIDEKIDIENNKKNLLEFARITEPSYSKYILILESFDPQKIGQKSFVINKKVITTL